MNIRWPLVRMPVISSLSETGIARRGIPRRRLFLALAALAVLLLALAACGRSTPPGPNAIYGTVEGNASYVLLDWPEGMRILILDDLVEGGHFNHGSGSTSDPVYRESGGAETDDGRGFEYNVETEDGLEADFTIDGVTYDLDRGTLFLIRAAGGDTQVQQLDLDLSGLEPTNDGIVDFSLNTPELAAFVAQSAAAAGE